MTDKLKIEEIYKSTGISIVKGMRTIQTYKSCGKKKHRKFRISGWVIGDHLFIHKPIEKNDWNWETWDITHWRSGVRLCSCSSWESAMMLAHDLALTADDQYPALNLKARSLRAFRTANEKTFTSVGYHFLHRMIKIHGELKYELCCGIEEADEKRSYSNAAWEVGRIACGYKRMIDQISSIRSIAERRLQEE